MSGVVRTTAGTLGFVVVDVPTTNMRFRACRVCRAGVYRAYRRLIRFKKVLDLWGCVFRAYSDRGCNHRGHAGVLQQLHRNT